MDLEGSSPRTQIKKEDPNPNEIWNNLLVVSTLIASVTFQAGVNPPGGVWQDTKVAGDINDNHKAGNAVYSSQETAFYVFLVFNTLALSCSVSAILDHCFRLYPHPFSFEIGIATLSMMFVYASSIFAISPHDGAYKCRYLLIVSIFPLVSRLVTMIYRNYKPISRIDQVYARNPSRIRSMSDH